MSNHQIETLLGFGAVLLVALVLEGILGIFNENGWDFAIVAAIGCFVFIFGSNTLTFLGLRSWGTVGYAIVNCTVTAISVITTQFAKPIPWNKGKK